jgi:SET domain
VPTDYSRTIGIWSGRKGLPPGHHAVTFSAFQFSSVISLDSFLFNISSNKRQTLTRSEMHQLDLKLTTTCSLLLFRETFGFCPLFVAPTPRKPLVDHNAAGTTPLRPLTAEPFGLGDTSDNRHRAIKSALSKLDHIYETSSSFFETIDAAVEVKPSLVVGAGMGMFAKRSIQRGTVISFYPVHAIGVDFGDTSVCIASSDVGQEYFNNRDRMGSNWNKDCNYQQYLIGSRPLAGYCVADLFDGDNLFVDVDPNQVDKAGWKGHYVNDAAVVETSGEEGIVQYYQRSRRGKNCVHVPLGPCPILAVVTTREVEQGEELFTTYGGSYWLEFLMSDAELVVTDAIRQESLATAKDLFASMQSISKTYQLEAERFGKC